MNADEEVWVCAFGTCSNEAEGFAPNGFLVCSSHAKRLGVKAIPVQRSGS